MITKPAGITEARRPKHPHNQDLKPQLYLGAERPDVIEDDSVSDAKIGLERKKNTPPRKTTD